jgi:hypothetical protein
LLTRICERKHQLIEDSANLAERRGCLVARYYALECKASVTPADLIEKKYVLAEMVALVRNGIAFERNCRSTGPSMAAECPSGLRQFLTNRTTVSEMWA